MTEKKRSSEEEREREEKRLLDGSPRPGRLPAGPGVAERVSGVRRHLEKRMLFAVLVWGATAGGGLLLLAWLLAGPEGWRQGSSGPLLLDGIVVASIGFTAALLFRWRRSRLSDRRLAASMEGASGLAPGTILGALELTRSVPKGTSPALARSAERGVARKLANAPSGNMPEALSGASGEIVSRWILRGSRALIVVAPLVLVVGFASPERAWRAWTGLALPFHLLAAPTFPPLAVEPGSVMLERGAPLPIAVRAEGRREVTLHWQAAGDVPASQVERVQDGSADFTLPEVTTPLRYWVSAPDGAVTSRFSVTLVDPLFLADLTVELVFPAYMDRFPEEYRGEPPPLTIPEGTRVRIEGRTSRNLERAELVAEDEGSGGVEFEVEDTHFTGEWIPTRGGLFHWKLNDVSGSEIEGGAAPLDLTLVEDTPPGIRFVYPGRDTVFPLSLRQPLVIEARDDHGLTRIELIAWRETSYGEGREPLTQPLDVPGSRSVEVRPTLNVSDWGLLPGDVVRYRARAVDNAPRPQSNETEEFVLRMPGASQMREDARDRLDEVSTRLEEVRERAVVAEEATRDLERQATTRPETSSSARRPPDARSSQMDFQSREDVRRALEEQEGMVGEIDALRSELESLSDFMRDAGLRDNQLRRDLNELQQLLREIAPTELAERLKELTKALDETDGRRSMEALQELTEEQERFRERLDESLDRFRRAAAEQELRAVTSESESIAREEKLLADAFREGEDPESRADQQAALEERARRMEERLEQLEERLSRLGEEEAQAMAEGARERSKEARQAMSEAGERARAAEAGEAGQRADQAAAAMEQVAEELQQMQEEMAEQRREEMMDALALIMSDALALARRQSELRGGMRQTRADALAELRADESALLQGVRNMAQNLDVLARAAPEHVRPIGIAMGQAMSAVEATMEALQSRRVLSLSPPAAAENAIQSLNNIALEAMKAMNARDQEGGGDGRSEALMEELEALAREQGEIMDDSQATMEMGMGAEGASQQMQRLAEGQESVAGGLDRLADQPTAQDQSLGDLQAMAAEARQLAQELAGGRLEPEILERQERLFRRLLDAGRSLEKEELSEEREAEVAGVFDAPEIPGLTPDALRALRFALPGAVELQRLTPAQRQLVLEYFERLNRSAPGRIDRQPEDRR